ncbi:hypothetical protein GCM10009534_07690 [Kribbella sandramycini]
MDVTVARAGPSIASWRRASATTITSWSTPYPSAISANPQGEPLNAPTAISRPAPMSNVVKVAAGNLYADPASALPIACAATVVATSNGMRVVGTPRSPASKPKYSSKARKPPSNATNPTAHRRRRDRTTSVNPDRSISPYSVNARREPEPDSAGALGDSWSV